MKTHKPVPPTRLYLSKRAEMFRREAQRATDAGERTKASELLRRAREYAILAGELDFEMEGQDEQLIHDRSV